MSSTLTIEKFFQLGVPILYESLVDTRDDCIDECDSQLNESLSLSRAERFKLQGKKIVTKAFFEVGSAFVTLLALIDYLVIRFPLGFFARVAMMFAPDKLYGKKPFKCFVKTFVQAEEMSRRTCIEALTGLVLNFFVDDLGARNEERRNKIAKYTAKAQKAMPTKESPMWIFYELRRGRV